MPQELQSGRIHCRASGANAQMSQMRKQECGQILFRRLCEDIEEELKSAAGRFGWPVLRHFRSGAIGYSRPAMIAGPSLQTIDHALRGGAIVLLLLIAALLLRDHARARAARLGWAFAVGVAAYAVCSSPEFALDAKPWHAPILVLCFGNSLVFWLFAR